MNIKTLVSGLALSAAMAISGPVFADTMVKGTAVIDANLPAVQARCNDLMSAPPVSLADANDSSKDANNTAQQANSDNGTANSGDTTPKVDTLADPALVALLDSLSAEDCTAAGMKATN